MLYGSEYCIGIEAGVTVCKEALQPLIDQLLIGVCELRADLLGSDRVPKGLDQLQPLYQRQGQKVINHRPCRQNRVAGTSQP